MFRIFKKSRKNDDSPKMSRFTSYPIGFHGDEYLLKVVDVLAAKSVNFVETGSNVGSTLGYFASKYPAVNCFSCEPDPEAYKNALRHVESKNVKLFNETSQKFIERLKSEFNLHEEPTLFWLDAHGYGFPWPLIEEMQYVLNHYKTFHILIDDFEVPGIPEFGFDAYDGQSCAHSYLVGHLPPRPYHLYYPTYKEKTSKHHPLRGWGIYSCEQTDWKSHGINFVRESQRAV